MPGHRKPQQLPPPVAENKKCEEFLKGNRRNYKKINRRDPVSVVVKEGLPCLRWSISPRYHVLRDCRLGDVETFDVAQSTVSKYMVPRRDRPSQTWKTFLHNHADGIASIDLFVVPTIAFEKLFAFLILGHGRRQLLWFAVTRHPTAEWLARQITEAFPWDTAPAYIVRDNDRAFGSVFRRRIQAMGIRDRPTSFRSPWQNGHVERLIGSIRRECTDHLIVLNEEHLRRILAKFSAYYNGWRPRVSLGKDAPDGRPIDRFGDIVAHAILGRLHHWYARI